MQNGIPRQVTIVSHSTQYTGAPQTPRLIKYGGPIFPLLDGHGPEYRKLDNGAITVAGHLYHYEQPVGERQDADDWYFGHTYRLMIGWQVLVSHNGDTAPDLKFPTEDRAKADHYARRVVTDNLILGTVLKAEIVWQEDGHYGEPVATCNGADHTLAQAMTRKQGEYLPLDPDPHPEPVEGGADPPPIKKGGGTTPPLSKTPSQRNPQEHYNTSGGHSQVTLTVRYQGAMPPPAKTKSTGQLVTYQVDSHEAPWPAHNLPEIRLWLYQNGYQPDYSHWQVLDRGHGPRRRLEAYVGATQILSRASRDGCPPDTDTDPISPQLLAAIEGTRCPPVTDEMRARWLAAGDEGRKQRKAARLAVGDHRDPQDRSSRFSHTDPWYRRTWTHGNTWGMSTRT